jgi:DNA invertase Pin-like site-specific DNA recombinase
MRALLYLRVSTDKQAEKGIAIPTQKEKCLECLTTNPYEFNEETDLYVDRGESARTMDRPALLEMLNRCERDQDIGAVIVYDVSRLARDRIDYAVIKQTLKKRNIRIISATESIDDSPEGQVLEGILSTFAEFYSTQNARRVKLNMARKVRDGWRVGLAPYGYKNVQEKIATGKVRAWVEVNWEEARWVQRAFELFATGNYSIRSLSKVLQAEGLPVRNRKGSDRKVHGSFLEKVLRDRFYIGVIKWGDVVNPNGKHETFLDPLLFEKVQAILDSRLGGGSRNRRLFSLLKGIAFCAECGSRSTLEEHTTSSGRLIRYVRCLKSQHSERVSCSQEYAHETEVLGQLEGLLKLVQLPAAFVEKLRNRIKALFADEQELYEKARRDMLGKIEEVKRRKKNLVMQLIDKRATEGDLEVYESVKAELNADEKRLVEDLGKIENQIAGVVRTVEIALALAANCFYAYQKAEPEIKALLVRTFFKKLLIRDKQIVQAVLNEPLDYLCRSRLQGYPVFDLAAVSGPNRSILEYIKSLPQRMSKYQAVLWENCYNRLQAVALA